MFQVEPEVVKPSEVSLQVDLMLGEPVYEKAEKSSLADETENCPFRKKQKFRKHRGKGKMMLDSNSHLMSQVLVDLLHGIVVSLHDSVYVSVIRKLNIF